MAEFVYEDDERDLSKVMQDDPINIEYDFLSVPVNRMTLLNVFGEPLNEENILYVSDQPRILVDEKYNELLGAFESVGIESIMYRGRQRKNSPFKRQHRYLDELGPLQYRGYEVVDLHFPTVGFEIVTRKYLRNFGIYTREHGVISCNKVSHIIYGFAEFPTGDEIVVFNIRTSEGLFSFVWDVDGLRRLGHEDQVAYFIKKPDNKILQVSGEYIPSIDSTRVQWFHYLELNDTLDYVVNIDGVNYLLFGSRKIIAGSDREEIFIGKQCDKLKCGMKSYFYDLDSKILLHSTTRAVESQGTLDHIMRDAIVVKEMKKNTKFLKGISQVNHPILYNVFIIPAGGSLVESDCDGRTVVFDRLSHHGTSRNYYVANRIKDRRMIFLDDTRGLSASFVGNNRIYYSRKRYFYPLSEGEKDEFKKYQGKIVYFLVNSTNAKGDFYEIQHRSVVPVRFKYYDESDTDYEIDKRVCEVAGEINIRAPSVVSYRYD